MSTASASIPAAPNVAAVFDAVKAMMPDSVLIDGPPNHLERSRYPRITWVPVRGVMSAGQIGPLALWTRNVTCAVTFWAHDEAEVGALQQLFVQLLHKLKTHHGYLLGEESWEFGGQGTSGVACTAAVTIRLPLLIAQPGTVPLAGINFTVEVES